jgi:hypothetical protein
LSWTKVPTGFPTLPWPGLEAIQPESCSVDIM